MNTNGKIPLVDLVTLHSELEADLLPVFRNALKTASFVGGPMVKGFEHDFAEYCGAQYCVGVGSGTDALRFALIAAGVKSGDIAITVPNTFIATTEAISQAGARPDFVDIDRRTYNMDVEKLQNYLETQCTITADNGPLIHLETGRPVTAIVPVHLYGQTADMDRILELAARYRLIVIEDACQAHGAEYFSRTNNQWKKAGSMSHAAAFSFYPGKNLGACGEGGAVTTDDEMLAKKVEMLRDHGQEKKYFHAVEGYNGRLDAIQAGILQVKLRALTEWNQKRRDNAARYNELLRPLAESVTVPSEPPWAKSVYHLYVIRVEDRETLRTHLDQSGVATGIHYPIPLHLQEAYRYLGYQAGDFPVSERVTSEIVSLPMYPQLRPDQQEYVVEKVVASIATTPTVRGIV